LPLNIMFFVKTYQQIRPKFFVKGKKITM